MITGAFNRSRAVISPDTLIRKKDYFPEVFISSFSRGFTEILTRDYKSRQIGKINIGYNIPIYTAGPIGYFESPIGAPAAVLAEELIFEAGAKSILYFGSCGSLDSRVFANTILIPEKAYRDEGTSYHYMAPSDYIDIPTSVRLKEVLDSLGIDYVAGNTWTTDAFFRETEDSIAMRKEEGCIAVEMECAALMAAASFRGKKAYQFLFAADCLDGEYNKGTLGSSEKHILETALKAAAKL